MAIAVWVRSRETLAQREYLVRPYLHLAILAQVDLGLDPSGWGSLAKSTTIHLA